MFGRLKQLLGIDGKQPSGDGQVYLAGLKIGDVREVHKIESASYLTPWTASAFERACEDDQEEFWVARLAGKIVGYAGFRKEPELGHIVNVTVHPDYRRRGIATLLLRHLFNRMRVTGYDRTYLEVRETNLAAQSLYRKLGFRPVRTVKGYYFDTGEDAVIMEFVLTAEPKR